MASLLLLSSFCCTLRTHLQLFERVFAGLLCAIELPLRRLAQCVCLLCVALFGLRLGDELVTVTDCPHEVCVCVFASGLVVCRGFAEEALLQAFKALLGCVRFARAGESAAELCVQLLADDQARRHLWRLFSIAARADAAGELA